MLFIICACMKTASRSQIDTLGSITQCLTCFSGIAVLKSFQ